MCALQYDQSQALPRASSPSQHLFSLCSYVAPMVCRPIPQDRSPGLGPNYTGVWLSLGQSAGHQAPGRAAGSPRDLGAGLGPGRSRHRDPAFQVPLPCCAYHRWPQEAFFSLSCCWYSRCCISRPHSGWAQACHSPSPAFLASSSYVLLSNGMTSPCQNLAACSIYINTPSPILAPGPEV